MNRYDQGPNYIAPRAPGEIVQARRQATIMPADPMQLPAAPATSEVILRTTYEDRARGWLLAVTPLSAVGGLAGVLLAAVGWAMPIFSLGALLVYFATFAGVWLLGYVVHTMVSPDGVALLHVLFAWRYVERERKARERAYRGLYERE